MIFQLDANPEAGKEPERFFAEFWNGSLSREALASVHTTADGADTVEVGDDGERAFTPLRLGGRAEIPPEEIPDDKTRRFSQSLVLGVLRHRDEIDRCISDRLRNWRLTRIGAVERAVLRLGAYELAFEKDENTEFEKPPSAVVINEAVDLAKYFGSNESGRFVNGILDAIARKMRDQRYRPQQQRRVWSPADGGDAPPAPRA